MFALAKPILADIQKAFAHCCSMLVVIQKQASRKTDKSLGCLVQGIPVDPVSSHLVRMLLQGMLR